MNLQELFIALVDKICKEEEEEEGAEKKDKPDWSWALNCVVFEVDKDDWDYIRTPKTIEKPEFLDDPKIGKVDKFLKSLEHYVQMDTSKLMYHFCQLEDKTLAGM